MVMNPCSGDPVFYFISCSSPVFHVLTGTVKMASQKLPTVRIEHDTTEAVKAVISFLDKQTRL
jgi:hypothetical protein